MASATAEKRMAKKRGRPSQPGGEGTQVRLDSDLVSMARYVTARRGASLVKYLSDILRPVVERDFAKAQPNIGPEGPSTN